MPRTSSARMARPSIPQGNGQRSQAQLYAASVERDSHGLIVQASVSQATGTAEREVSLEMLDAESGFDRKTLGADKNFNAKVFMEGAASAV